MVTQETYSQPSTDLKLKIFAKDKSNLLSTNFKPKTKTKTKLLNNNKQTNNNSDSDTI